NKVVVQPKDKEEKKIAEQKDVSSVSPVPSQIVASPAAIAPANTTSAPPVVQTAQAKPEPVNPPPPVSKPDEAKPEEATSKDEEYKNGMADIGGYIDGVLMNIFTPNGDGKNDVFEIKAKNLNSLAVTIFDQSGKLVYQWNGLDGMWDGNLADGRP